MATEKTLKTRVVLKHDTEANWKTAGEAANPFVPKKGEVIIYDPDGNYVHSRQKIGDGKTRINDLPFSSVDPLTIVTFNYDLYGEDLGITKNDYDKLSKSTVIIVEQMMNSVGNFIDVAFYYHSMDLSTGTFIYFSPYTKQYIEISSTPTAKWGVPSSAPSYGFDITGIADGSQIDADEWAAHRGFYTYLKETDSTDSDKVYYYGCVGSMDNGGSPETFYYYCVANDTYCEIDNLAYVSRTKNYLVAALSNDFWKIQKTNGATPYYIGGTATYRVGTNLPSADTFVLRTSGGGGVFNNVEARGALTGLNGATPSYPEQIARSANPTYSEIEIEETSSDTGTITSNILGYLTTFPQVHILYVNQIYYRMDSLSTPNGTLNYFHTDESGTTKYFTITKSDLSWKVTTVSSSSVKVGTTTSSEDLTSVTYLSESDLSAIGAPTQDTQYCITDLIGEGDLDSDLQAKISRIDAISSKLSNYLPLTGGTLTGDLTATNETLNGNLEVKNTSFFATADQVMTKIDYTGVAIIDQAESSDSYKIKLKTNGEISFESGAAAISANNLKLKSQSGEFAVNIDGAEVAFYGDGGTYKVCSIGGISDSKGTSSTTAASQKCLNDNYLAKTDITFSTTDLVAGSSALATGSLYFVYE